jgi:hypothetical protein
VHVTLSNTLVTDHIAIIVTQSISSVNNATRGSAGKAGVAALCALGSSLLVGRAA